AASTTTSRFSMPFSSAFSRRSRQFSGCGSTATARSKCFASAGNVVEPMLAPTSRMSPGCQGAPRRRLRRSCATASSSAPISTRDPETNSLRPATSSCVDTTSLSAPTSATRCGVSSAASAQNCSRRMTSRAARFSVWVAVPAPPRSSWACFAFLFPFALGSGLSLRARARPSLPGTLSAPTPSRPRLGLLGKPGGLQPLARLRRGRGRFRLSRRRFGSRLGRLGAAVQDRVEVHSLGLLRPQAQDEDVREPVLPRWTDDAALRVELLDREQPVLLVSGPSCPQAREMRVMRADDLPDRVRLPSRRKARGIPLEGHRDAPPDELERTFEDLALVVLGVDPEQAHAVGVKGSLSRERVQRDGLHLRHLFLADELESLLVGRDPVIAALRTIEDEVETKRAEVLGLRLDRNRVCERVRHERRHRRAADVRADVDERAPGDRLLAEKRARREYA